MAERQEEKLREAVAQHKEIMRAAEQVQTRIMTIVDVMGWSADEANEIIGEPYLADQSPNGPVQEQSEAVQTPSEVAQPEPASEQKDA